MPGPNLAPACTRYYHRSISPLSKQAAGYNLDAGPRCSDKDEKSPTVDKYSIDIRRIRPSHAVCRMPAADRRGAIAQENPNSVGHTPLRNKAGVENAASQVLETGKGRSHKLHQQHRLPWRAGQGGPLVLRSPFREMTTRRVEPAARKRGCKQIPQISTPGTHTAIGGDRPSAGRVPTPV